MRCASDVFAQYGFLVVPAGKEETFHVALNPVADFVKEQEDAKGNASRDHCILLLTVQSQDAFRQFLESEEG